jgi:tape measure domain-containing protein
MATVLKAGAIKIDLEANAKNLINGFKNAIKSLDSFKKETNKQTSSSKRLEDQLKALERRKANLEIRIKNLNIAGKQNTNMYHNVSTQLANVNDRIQTQNIRIAEYQGKISKTNGILSGFASALSNVGKVGQNAMQGLFSSITRVAEIAIGNVLASGITRATTMLINFGKTAFGLTVDMQDVRGGFESMLGSAEQAQSMLRSLSEYNKKTPFTLPQLQEQAANLLAVGVSADKIIPTLDVLGKISRGNANRMGFLTLAYGQVQTATRLTGAELRQFTENGVPLLDMLAQQTGKSTQEMRESITDGAVSFEMVEKALQSTIQEGGRFYNYFEKQNKNFSFVMSNITDYLEEVSRSILGITETGDIIDGGLFDKVTSGANKLLRYIELNKDMIISLGQNGIQQIIKLATGVYSLIKNFDISRKKIIDFSQDLIARFKNITTTLQKYFKPEITFLTNTFTIISENIEKYLLPVLALLAGTIIWMVSNALVMLQYAWENLREPILDFLAAIINVWDALNPVVAAISALTMVLIIGLMPVIQILWAIVVQAFSGILRMVTGVINIIAGILNIFIGVLEGLFIGDFSRIVKGFEQIWKGLKQFIEGWWVGFVSLFKGGVGGIRNIFKSIDLFKVGVDMMQGLINGISNMSKSINKKVDEIANGITNKFKEVLKIKSPSRVMIEGGLDTGKGIELGLEKSKVGIISQVESISKLIIDSINPVDTTQDQIINKNKNITINNYNSGNPNPFPDFSTAF